MDLTHEYFARYRHAELIRDAEQARLGRPVHPDRPWRRRRPRPC